MIWYVLELKIGDDGDEKRKIKIVLCICSFVVDSYAALKGPWRAINHELLSQESDASNERVSSQTNYRITIKCRVQP